jgi:hypothetical protein
MYSLSPVVSFQEVDNELSSKIEGFHDYRGCHILDVYILLTYIIDKNNLLERYLYVVSIQSKIRFHFYFISM